MQDERKKAIELLKTGEYYNEAIKWYNSRYVMPKTQLATMALFAFVAISFFMVSFVSTISIFPLKQPESFTIDREFDLSEGMVINKIGDEKEDISVAYLQYMLAEYVKSREEYNPRKTDRNFNFVIELSSDDIFMDYLTIADKNQNPNHPVWLYGSQAVKEIRVSNTTLNDIDPKLKNFDSKKQYTATVNYVSSLLFVDNLETQEKLQALVSFTFEPIIIDQKTNAIKQLPKLVITGYKSKKSESL